MQPLSQLTWNDKKRLRAFAAGALAAAALVPTFTGLGSTASASSIASVIVREAPGYQTLADRAISDAGGRITQHIGLIDASVAHVPASSLPWLSAQPGILSVSPDASAHLLSSTYTPAHTNMDTVAAQIGVDKVWKAGYTGAGVGVALIDSGVASVAGLDTAGKVINGPDLSFDGGNSSLRYVDEYGHGTHMAGIIAGRDANLKAPYTPNSGGFLGIAPDAHIVNVKVATANGATDVSQIIAAIDWVVQHRNDPGMNIRVLNLSFGTDSTQSYLIDPLAYAAEMAWRYGIVVVSAAGNNGSTAKGLSNPAIDPYVISVGASTNYNTNTGSFGEELFSSLGNALRNPDIAAPGQSIASLRVPGSYIDQNWGFSGRLGTRFFVGSGTSQSTAVVSGVAALLVQEYPWAPNDQIKALITGGAIPLLGGHVNKSGAGEISAATSALNGLPWASYAAQVIANSNGFGSLEASRGSLHVTYKGNTLTGERDIFGRPVSTQFLAAQEAGAGAWSGGDWNGTPSSGGGWSGGSWSGGSWSGTFWYGGSWSGGSWSGGSWSGGSWSGGSWSGGSWSGGSWSGGSWSGGSWSTAGWADAYWA